jgi:hypothetical protein
MQVRNYHATLRHQRASQPKVVTQDKPVSEHAAALQALANGNAVSYTSTLRAVQCEGSRGPHQPPHVSRKAPVRCYFAGKVPCVRNLCYDVGA